MMLRFAKKPTKSEPKRKVVNTMSKPAYTEKSTYAYATVTKDGHFKKAGKVLGYTGYMDEHFETLDWARKLSILKANVKALLAAKEAIDKEDGNDSGHVA
jgi:hypothetical protein